MACIFMVDISITPPNRELGIGFAASSLSSCYVVIAPTNSREGTAAAFGQRQAFAK